MQIKIEVEATGKGAQSIKGRWSRPAEVLYQLRIQGAKSLAAGKFPLKTCAAPR